MLASLSGRQQRQAIKFFIRQLNRWSTLEFFSFHLHEKCSYFIFTPVRHSWTYSWLVTSNQTLHVRQALSGVGELKKEREKVIKNSCCVRRSTLTCRSREVQTFTNKFSLASTEPTCGVSKTSFVKTFPKCNKAQNGTWSSFAASQYFLTLFCGVIDPRSRNCQQFNSTLEIFRIRFAGRDHNYVNKRWIKESTNQCIRSGAWQWQSYETNHNKIYWFLQSAPNSTGHSRARVSHAPSKSVKVKAEKPLKRGETRETMFVLSRS